MDHNYLPFNSFSCFFNDLNILFLVIKVRKKSLRTSNRDVTFDKIPNTSLNTSKTECKSTPECIAEDMVETSFASNIYFDPLDESSFDDSRNLHMSLIKEETYDTQQENYLEECNHTDQNEHQNANKMSIEDFLQKILKEMNQNNKDEDRQFMLSLVPSLKKLNAKNKLKAKIQIMKVLEKMSM